MFFIPWADTEPQNISMAFQTVRDSRGQRLDFYGGTFCPAIGVRRPTAFPSPWDDRLFLIRRDRPHFGFSTEHVEEFLFIGQEPPGAKRAAYSRGVTVRGGGGGYSEKGEGGGFNPEGAPCPTS